MNLYACDWSTKFYTKKGDGSLQSFLFYIIHNDLLSMKSFNITPFIINYSIDTSANTNNDNLMEDDNGSIN